MNKILDTPRFWRQIKYNHNCKEDKTFPASTVLQDETSGQHELEDIA